MIKQILRTYRQFNDLTESEKTVCIEKHHNSFDDLMENLLNEQLENEILPMLHDNGFLIDKKDIEYDLNYCQGRGACFYTKYQPNLQYDLLFDGLEIPHKKWLFKIIDDYCEVELKKINTLYSHENTVRFNLYLNDGGNTHLRIEKKLEKMSNYAEKKRHDLSCEICNRLTENWENYMLSDDFIKNILTDNGYYFDDDLNIVDIDSIENKEAINDLNFDTITQKYSDDYFDDFTKDLIKKSIELLKMLNDGNFEYDTLETDCILHGIRHLINNIDV